MSTEAQRFNFVRQWNDAVHLLRPLPRMTREEWIRNPVGPPPAPVPSMEDIDQAMKFLDEQMMQIELFGEGWRGQTYEAFERILELLSYLYRCRMRELETGEES